MDDNFESIVKAVKWGRSVYDNIGPWAPPAAFGDACLLKDRQADRLCCSQSARAGLAGACLCPFRYGVSAH